METPTKYKPFPTQRSSERKRSLFERCSLQRESLEDIGQMSPLQFSSSPMRLSSGLRNFNDDEQDQENVHMGDDLLSPNTNRSKRRILTDIGSQNKIIKLSEDVIKKSPSSVISTKSFYSKPPVNIPVPYKREILKMTITQSKKRSSTQPKKKGFKVFGLINKGVGHKIFKPRPIIKKAHKASPTVKNIVKIVKNYSNDITAIEKKAEEGISSQQLLRIKNIMKNMKNPIEMARPLSVNLKQVQTKNQEIVPVGSEYQDPPGKRKLLKSKPSSNNKYRVTDKISATFCRGKISFIANKDDKEFKLYEELENSDEQIEIDGIINRLQDLQSSVPAVTIPIPSEEKIDLENLIPADPIVIEQQQNMLDFLICNNICTVENIKIFITEPENHKDEASKILNDLIVITTESDQNTEMDMEEIIISPTSQINNLTSSREENQEKIFPIFKKGFQAPLTTDDTQTGKQVNKIKWKPCGTDQLQIDAGQKQFGAKECVECGFIYSIHEPDDEIAHMNFHNHLHVLKFKGWTNELVVANVDQWGVNGRIIAVSQQESKAKIERVEEVLKIADSELGFPDNVKLHAKSMVYLAIGKSAIMGIVVVEPKKEAFKIVEENGIEVFSTETYPVKCGISRIWVPAAYRRQEVATNLIRAVQSHFFFAYTLSMNEIAFSTPTVMGKSFAKSLSNDVMVYQ